MEKLTLRPAIDEDATFVFEMMQNKDFQKHYLERLIFKSVEDAKNEIIKFAREAKRKNAFYFIVMLGKEKIGILDIYKISKNDKKASIGYGILRGHWGKGYGKQICKMGIEYANNKLKLHSMEATADPKNKASQRVLEKNGFIKLCTAKDYYFDRGQFVDRDLYWKILK
ncbi:MAG: GNAT family N-acetyltransferase [archaeon]